MCDKLSYPQTSQTSPLDCFDFDVDYLGGAIAGFDSHTSAAQCQSTCLLYPGCTLFEWDISPQICYLKNVPPNRVNQSGTMKIFQFQRFVLNTGGPHYLQKIVTTKKNEIYAT
jgi:hypothetical protein